MPTGKKIVPLARALPAIALAGALTACTAGGPPATPVDAAPAGPAVAGQPAGWDDALRLTELPDLDPDPHVLEVNLDARVTSASFIAGTTTPIWGYAGTVPGPLLHVRAGDRLIVHFTNHLPEPTTIHWHGLRIPVAMDGVPDNPTPAVPPGGSFDYDFVAPDPGLYWYHPHMNSARQEGAGLYGALLVDAPDEPAGVGDPLVLVLSDLDLQPDGTLAPPDAGGDVATLFGREGAALLVNGRINPVLRARAGVRQRWRVLNAARSRYYQLAAEGQHFLRIGGDAGRIAEPVPVERPVLTPGQRADLIWEPTAAPGTEIPLRWVPYDRGWGTTFRRPEVDVLRLAVEAAPATAPPLPPLARPVQALEVAGATPVSIQLTRNDVNKKFYLGINGKAFGGNDHVMAKVGETQVWTIENTIDFAHPFHIHGFFFQVLDAAGQPQQPIEWHDTADVPSKQTVKIAVRFDDRPGMWMFHCHILDHADAGMMGMIMLEEK